MKVQHLQRVDDAQPIEAIQLLMGRLPHEWVHVYGVDGLGVGVLLHHTSDCAEHTVHRLAKVLTTMRRD